MATVDVNRLASADMIAETGDIDKTTAAIQFIDTCLEGICDKVAQAGGVVIITSTHGHCEEMTHTESDEANVSSTSNPVPLHYVDEREKGIKLRENGSLEDIAPTILGILGIEKPAEMTGTDLRIL